MPCSKNRILSVSSARTGKFMKDLILNIADDNRADSNQFLTFAVLGKSMAISIDDVKEIIEIGNMTRVPMSNPCIRGVINLRGNVVPVVDLGMRLQKHLIDLDKRSCIVLVETHQQDESQVLGMLVDEVNEILDIEPQHMQKTPEFGTEIRPEYIEYMGRSGDEFIIVLELDRVLAIDELASIRQDTKAVAEVTDASIQTSA